MKYIKHNSTRYIFSGTELFPDSLLEKCLTKENIKCIIQISTFHIRKLYLKINRIVGINP